MFMSAPFRRIRLGKESRKGKRGGSSALFFTASTNYNNLYDWVSAEEYCTFWQPSLLSDILFFHQYNVEASQRYVKKSATRQQILPF